MGFRKRLGNEHPGFLRPEKDGVSFSDPVTNIHEHKEQETTLDSSSLLAFKISPQWKWRFVLQHVKSTWSISHIVVVC